MDVLHHPRRPDQKSWIWREFRALPAETVTVDIHCVTRWSKLDTEWRGVSLETLLDQVEHDAPYVMAFCDGGYTTNLPIDDITGGQAWVAYGYDVDLIAEVGAGQNPSMLMMLAVR
jgi:DMSO/TMAO reductase YedYZ molybdopterin-dependent catalytic subunit